MRVITSLGHLPLLSLAGFEFARFLDAKTSVDKRLSYVNLLFTRPKPASASNLIEVFDFSSA